MGRLWVRFPAAALLGNNAGQTVHTNVLQFTKRYNFVWYLVRAFMITPLYVEAVHRSTEQEEYCSSGSEAILIA